MNRYVIPLLVAGALAFACGPRSHSTATASAQTVALSTVAKLPVRQRAGRPEVPKLSSSFGVQLDRKSVRLALNVTNVGRNRVELNFPNGRAYDFAVQDSAGKEVWRWTDGRMFTQAIQNKALGSGETMKIDERFGEKLPAGRYTAIATLNSTNYPVEQRVDFMLR